MLFQLTWLCLLAVAVADDTCGDNKWACKSGQCIKKRFVCDGDQYGPDDCTDGSDEWQDCADAVTCGTGRTACNDGQACFENYKFCNKQKDVCADGSDNYAGCENDILDKAHLGCYLEGNRSDDYDYFATPEACIAFCKGDGTYHYNSKPKYPYASLDSGYVCYCWDSLGASVPASRCELPCPRDSTRTCGGSYDPVTGDVPLDVYTTYVNLRAIPKP